MPIHWVFGNVHVTPLCWVFFTVPLISFPPRPLLATLLSSTTCLGSWHLRAVPLASLLLTFRWDWPKGSAIGVSKVGREGDWVFSVPVGCVPHHTAHTLLGGLSPDYSSHWVLGTCLFPSASSGQRMIKVSAVATSWVLHYLILILLILPSKWIVSPHPPKFPCWSPNP